ncbi:hypothetical protein [Paenibacillus soyae]|uniref:Uncharacterized protein n=1 Tax=Paenibacillus soyae TaxID=2969249 RepID=A0A9X2MRK4_9BACL|nr:hypothetical protein [Paenibacillus soyae]MCR2804481.1 hypothetical protein [Paenibacillus soyae]
MRGPARGVTRVLEQLACAERLFSHMERRGTETHVKNAVKEWLLASRSVIDSVIDTLEEEQAVPTVRKIDILKGE